MINRANNNIEITQDNFFISSKADFKEIDDFDISLQADYISYLRKVIWGISLNNIIFDLNGIPKAIVYKEKTCDIIKYYTSKKNELGFLIETNEISSKYWFTVNGLYRESDHWGICRDCYWTLDGKEINIKATAYCNWNDFRYIN